MKQFKDLKVGDKIFESFLLKKPIDGFHNFQECVTVKEVCLDPNDSDITNVWCNCDDGSIMEFDLFKQDLNKTFIVDNNDSWIKVYST